MSTPAATIRSGSLVAVNHLAGVIITVASALLLSRALGPREFAVYTLCFSLSGVLRGVSRLGVNAWLLAQRDEPDAEQYQVALATMLTSSLLVAGITLPILPWLGEFSRIERFFWPGVATVALLPLHVLPLPALVQLERRLRYQPLIAIELSSQIVGQTIGITLAFAGWGIWGPLTGWGVRAGYQMVAPWLVVGQRPRLHWDRTHARTMLSYGINYVVSSNLAQSRSLVTLALAGRLLGQESVGYLGLALRAAGLAAPFRAAVSRVLVPTIAPVAHEPAVLRRTVATTVELEMLLSAPVMVAAVAIYPLAARLLLGPAWQPSVPLFPWVAAGSLLLAVHAAALSALHVRGLFWEAIASTVIGYGALAAAMTATVGAMGLEGCAAAMVASWPAAWLYEWFARRRLGTHWSRHAVLWAVAGASACLAVRVSPWLFLPSVAICLVTQQGIRERFQGIRAAFAGTQSHDNRP